MRDSTVSNPGVDGRILIALAAGIVVLFYLLVSVRTYALGFPLDDTWIHLTYARNFAEHGEWAFRLGDRSAGSTSPLWTFLLGLGYFLQLAPYLWIYILGWILLTLLGIHAEQMARHFIPAYRPPIPYVGFFFVAAWHLTWSAVSGMETLLHAYLIFVILTMLMSGSRRYLALGVLTGISIWVRPDGVTLLGPLVFTAILVEKSNARRIEAVVKTMIGFGGLFGPYLLLNLALAGTPLPSTFYAKQAEYQAFWMAQPIASRLVEYLWPILASPFIVLVPGAVLWLRDMVRTRNWGAIGGLIWFVGYVALYFMRLPAYQHGRYLIPAFPVMYLWGMLGMLAVVVSGKLRKLAAFAWQVLLVLVALGFSVLGARQNAMDVYWVESEIVNTAKWARENIPPDALIAAHDIGALGYFGEHAILDLAGLVSSDVVEFIRDQDRLAEYMDARKVEYLITFPGFYPELVSQLEVLYPAAGDCTGTLPKETMCVYHWKSKPHETEMQ